MSAPCACYLQLCLSFCVARARAEDDCYGSIHDPPTAPRGVVYAFIAQLYGIIPAWPNYTHNTHHLQGLLQAHTEPAADRCQVHTQETRARYCCTGCVHGTHSAAVWMSCIMQSLQSPSGKQGKLTCLCTWPTGDVQADQTLGLQPNTCDAPFRCDRASFTFTKSAACIPYRALFLFSVTHLADHTYARRHRRPLHNCSVDSLGSSRKNELMSCWC